MNRKLTLEDVAYSLCDGLEYTDSEKTFIRHRLAEIAEEDGLSAERLDDLCWEDSASMLDRIFGY